MENNTGTTDAGSTQVAQSTDAGQTTQGGVASSAPQNIVGGNTTQTQTTLQSIVDAEGNLSDNWYESFESEEIKNAPSLRNFKSMEGLVKSFLSAQRMVGKSPHAVVIPDENATEEERNEFFTKIGRPESPDEYNIKPPENLDELGLQWNDENAKAFANKAHELGLTNKQAQDLVNWHNEITVGSIKTAGEQVGQEYEQATQELKKEWGNAYDSNVKLVDTFINKLGLSELVINKGLANDPTFIKAMRGIAMKTSEDQFIEGDVRDTPSNAQEEINRIMGDKTHPYFNQDHPAHGDAVKKMNELYSRAHPEIN